MIMYFLFLSSLDHKPSMIFTVTWTYNKVVWQGKLISFSFVNWKSLQSQFFPYITIHYTAASHGSMVVFHA